MDLEFGRSSEKGSTTYRTGRWAIGEHLSVMMNHEPKLDPMSGS